MIANKDTTAVGGAEALVAELDLRRHCRVVPRRPQILARGQVQDAELLGVPTTVVVGRGFTNGVVEVRTGSPARPGDFRRRCGGGDRGDHSGIGPARRRLDEHL